MFGTIVSKRVFVCIPFFYKSIGVLERVEPGTHLRVGFLKSSDFGTGSRN
jgi:hypothetical protein